MKSDLTRQLLRGLERDELRDELSELLSDYKALCTNDADLVRTRCAEVSELFHEWQKPKAIIPPPTEKEREDLSELVSDYERLATDAGGNVSQSRKQRIKKVRVLLLKLREPKRYQP